MKKKYAAMLWCMLFSTPFIQAGEINPVEVGITEKLEHSIPLHLSFVDDKGNRVLLKNIIRKPTILNFVYYRCPGICSPILTELTNAVNTMDLKPGKDYQILTISFDEREKFDLAAGKKESYFDLLDKNIPDSSWKFLTGDSVSIRTLTDAAGFMFKRDGNDFIHPGALIFITPEGKIVRYLLGTQFLPFDVKMALIEASTGKSGSTTGFFLRMCYSYSPERRTYVFNVVRVAGAGVIIFGLAAAFVITVKAKRNKTAKVK
ncbi:MAG: SCO family protein [Bacteroidetes bacterium]|nr:SCO family protein [Bacteroidota bacterium]